MQKEYLLDTNAYFNLLRAANFSVGGENPLAEQLEVLNSGKVYISTITQVEIISVLGKYARGITGGFQKCSCQITGDGEVCTNSRYISPRKKWNTRIIKGWLQLIKETVDGHSTLINLDVLPFDDSTIVEAQQIVLYALTNNFASMDAMIAATAKKAIDNHQDISVVTSDKGLKACLRKCEIPYWDLFQPN